MSGRWVRLWIPEHRWERETWGDRVVIGEAPKGIGREVRLATEAETGVFARLALPKPAHTPTDSEEGGAHNRREG